MDKQLETAFKYIKSETDRLMDAVLNDEMLESKDWDIVNKLGEVFAKDIRKLWEE